MSVLCGGSSDILLRLLHKETLTPPKLNKEGPPDHSEALPHIPLVQPGTKMLGTEVRWHDQGSPIPHSSPATGLGHWYQLGMGKTNCLGSRAVLSGPRVSCGPGPLYPPHSFPWLVWAVLSQKAITCVWLALVLVNPSCLLHMTSYLSQMAPYSSGYSFRSMLLNSFPKHFPDLYFLGMAVLGIGRKRNSLLWLQMYWLIQN